MLFCYNMGALNKVTISKLICPQGFKTFPKQIKTITEKICKNTLKCYQKKNKNDLYEEAF